MSQPNNPYLFKSAYASGAGYIADMQKGKEAERAEKDQATRNADTARAERIKADTDRQNKIGQDADARIAAGGAIGPVPVDGKEAPATKPNAPAAPGINWGEYAPYLAGGGLGGLGGLLLANATTPDGEETSNTKRVLLSLLGGGLGVAGAHAMNGGNFDGIKNMFSPGAAATPPAS